MPLEIDDAKVKNAYELLSIIDNKASALLTFNALFLASISIWLGYVGPNYLHGILDIVFLALLVSSGQLLRVIGLKWANLAQVVEHSYEALEGLRERRTSYYRSAWKISAVCIVAVVLVTLVHTFGTWLKATSNCGPWCTWFFDPALFGNLDTAP